MPIGFEKLAKLLVLSNLTFECWLHKAVLSHLLLDIGVKKLDILFNFSSEILLLLKLILLPVNYVIERKGLRFKPFDITLQLRNPIVFA